MKKVVALITILVLLTLPTALAATSVTNVHDFEIRFGAASLFTESARHGDGSNVLTGMAKDGMLFPQGR
jgi:hypothetical protein